MRKLPVYLNLSHSRSENFSMDFNVSILKVDEYNLNLIIVNMFSNYITFIETSK